MDRRAYPFEGTEPAVHETARVSRESTLVGDVSVGPDASVWPGAVLRGDVDAVVVGESAHVGDNASVHASRLGDRAMVGHGSVVNDSVVGADSLVGFNATVDESEVGARCVVATGTVVPEGMSVPDESFVRGVPGSYTPLSETTVDVEELFETYHSGRYGDLAARHEALFE
ncbi:gamma carbonic anhydrase family protein [Halorarius halobius]|uniref:gamma carbonic anhydrase family protein n=1 Tax=Halorarius halobius TaxID=2962671 RepID=UPI0020CC9ADA|nr:gamma carbonic anhydrase family protein [Halorarius halobius]